MTWQGTRWLTLVKPSLKYREMGSLPPRALSDIFTTQFMEARWLLPFYMNGAVVEAVLWWMGILDLVTGNTCNMNIHCYFVIGRRRLSWMLLQGVARSNLKRLGKIATFFLQCLSKDIVGYHKHYISRKLRTPSHKAVLCTASQLRLSASLHSHSQGCQ